MYLAVLNGIFILRALAPPSRAYAYQLYWIVLIFLFVFSAFRFRVGCDWFGYYNNYAEGTTLDYADAIQKGEPLWWVIQVAFYRAGISFPWVNVLTSAIFFFGIHAFARRQPDRLGFLVLLFPVLIINMPMSGIRQGAAIGLFCLSMLAFIDQRPLRFVAWILLASTIHSSILVFLALTPLTLGEFSKTRLIMTGLLALPAIFLISQTDALVSSVERYGTTASSIGLEAFGAVYRVTIVSLTGLYFLLMLQKSWARQFPKDFGLAIVGSLLMVSVILTLPVSSIVADRYAYYLIPIQVMIFARIPYLKLGHTRKLQAAVPYIGLLLVFAVWTRTSSLFYSCYVPYTSWLFGYPEGTRPFPFE